MDSQFPFMRNSWKGIFRFKQDGALIYEITPENGIERKGDLLRPEDPGQMYEEWESSIQRIVYAGDTIYTQLR